jgi:chaperonin GroEL (HSP60 family)
MTFSDMNQGTIGSMRQLGVTESYKLKRQVVLSASEAAEMIIRYAAHLSNDKPSLDLGCEQGG